MQNQDKIRRIVLSISQFHVYANDLRGVGTEPRHQELSVNQYHPSLGSLVVMVTEDKAWSLLESSAYLFRWLVG